MQGLDGTISFKVKFKVPNKIGDLPEVDFDYPVTATRFSMHTGNLLLVAMDDDERERPRIFISAQLNKQNQTYEGQYMADFGGNQLQLNNGPVFCKLE
ncbi:hypothetical protein [Legionella parisiensis]|uniref:Uncharacterized protein n=1 Tax=Legionella parisiensis TaxID=45071 RepID=A0A1E5JSI0_9GAMM|nr:hypothetical protein [Legionella parisiensis]KTD43178.1 hypothetical protein Lpar_1155 [Legionella parisiensis]OEH47465.1 hypothetical protein lpari_01528 [Legionella parisiensis]STX77741.1 Uncharacterised protein [Legionella parisiensis]